MGRRDLAVEAVGADSSGRSGGDAPVEAAEAAEAEEARAVIDDFDRELDEAFGVVTEWWVGPVGRLGVMRLPLP